MRKSDTEKVSRITPELRLGRENTDLTVTTPELRLIHKNIDLTESYQSS